MDIWDWVTDVIWELQDEGRYQLAELIVEMPSAVVDLRPDDVHRIYHDAMGLLDKTRYPWLEIYFRHWRLQFEVLNQMNAKSQMMEAIDLLEVAHRPENEKCPQSVCVVQDITNCYGLRDGLGFAPERLAITQEGLAKIDFSWACFNCIGSEYLDALIDTGRAEEALAQIHQWRAESVVANNAYLRGNQLFQKTVLRCLIALEQYENAIHAARKTESIGGGERFDQEIRFLLALSYLGNGQIDDAVATCVSYEITGKTPDDYVLWMNFWYKLAQLKPEYNKTELNEKFEHLIGVLEEKGIQRISLNARKQQAHLAHARKDQEALDHAIKKFELIVNALERDCGATNELSELQRLSINTL